MSEKSAMMEDGENAGDGGERDGEPSPQVPDSRKSSSESLRGKRQQASVQHFGGGGGGGGSIPKGGILEAGYETFAAAAARSGFVGAGGGAGSPPSEERGWLNFIPNLLLSRGNSAQQKTSHSEIDPLFVRRDASSNPDLPPSIDRFVDDSNIPNNATRYTHFADTFHTRHSSSASFDVQNLPLNNRPISSLPDLSEEMTDVDSIGVDNYAGRIESRLAVGSTTPKSLFSAFKSFPVHVTAVGDMMPTTPNTPVFERPKEVNNGTFIGGFGVSVKMIPTESTELLHPPSPGEHTSHANAGASQFYSFHNNYSDEHQSKNDANNAAYSTFLNDLGQSGEYDGGDEEEERASSNNMISFYSGEGANEGFRYVRSPSKASRRLHSSQKHPENTQHSRRPPSGSSTREADSGGGNFILSLLFGNSRDSILNNMTVSAQAPASQSRGVVGYSGEGGRGRRRRPGSRQRRAAAAAKRKQARLRKQRRLRRQNERVPQHLRVAHQRAAAITER